MRITFDIDVEPLQDNQYLMEIRCWDSHGHVSMLEHLVLDDPDDIDELLTELEQSNLLSATLRLLLTGIA